MVTDYKLLLLPRSLAVSHLLTFQHPIINMYSVLPFGEWKTTGYFLGNTGRLQGKKGEFWEKQRLDDSVTEEPQ